MSWTLVTVETMIDHNRSGIDHGRRGVAAEVSVSGNTRRRYATTKSTTRCCLTLLTDDSSESSACPRPPPCKRLLKAIVRSGVHGNNGPKPTNPAPTPTSATSPSAANSPLCSAIPSARPPCRRALIPRICARSSGPTNDACSSAVARYDGFVAKFMGDGVLASFRILRLRMRTTPSGRRGRALISARYRGED